MKGDDRIEARCPICPHVCKVTPRRKERGFVKETTTEGMFKNALRCHIVRDHYDLSPRQVMLAVDRAWQDAINEMRAGPTTRGHASACMAADPSAGDAPRPLSEAHGAASPVPPIGGASDKPCGAVVARATN